MTTKAQNASPFSRLSRMTFGLSSKFNSVSSPRPKPQLSDNINQDEEDWYIPYNGPYEPPRPSARQEKNRDSWGDPIDGTEQVEDEEHILGDPELHIRYGGIDSGNSGEWKGGGSGNGDDSKLRQRNRTQSGGSVFSGRTVSSGTVDPGRMSMGTHPRRSTVSSNGPRPPIPSYVNMDVTGGVGETPIPSYRASSSRDTSSTPTRKSLASLFTFNSSSRRQTTSRPSPDPNRPPIPSPSLAQNQDTGKQPSSLNRSRTDPILVEEALRASSGTNDGEYYSAFYSSLIHPTADNKQPTYDSEPSNHTNAYSGHPTPFRKEPYSSSSDPTSSSAPHPYAYPFSEPLAINSPQSAPPTQKSHLNISVRNHDTQYTSFAQPQSASTESRHLPLPLRQHALKNSASTPNLRGTRQQSPSQPRWNFKDRLLAAETWCDALLFPRPRLKLKQEGVGTPPYNGSGRIVSPPGSPIFDQPQALGAQLSVASRVLAHSRSLVDLSTPGVAGPSTWRREEERAMVLPDPKPVEKPATNLTPSKPPRPKSWALDDSVLPSPVPSLARVLEEGQILEHQRKKWQTQAINSFQNERARTLSRSRTKSLKAKKGGKRPDKTHPHIEFLAARGLLGNQDPIPIHIRPPREAGDRPRSNSQTDNRGTIFGWPSTSGHGHSLSKATSKSSKSHSRNHSRSDSFGKSALKVAKSTAALCVGGIVITPVEEKDKDKLAVFGEDHDIRLPTPLHVGQISPFDVHISPTSTGISDPNVGIAISTTPVTDETFDRESIRLPSHPYAQGGFSVYVSHQDDEVARADTTPTQPSRSSPSSQTQQNVPSAHPYALASSVDDHDSRIVPQARPDSLVPPPEKMWANWGTGGPYEVLPSDLQYSPFIVTGDGEDEKLPIRRSMRNSSPIYDTAGIGEALAWAAHRQSRDSGVGTSEGPESIAIGGQGSVSEDHSPVGMAIPSGSANRYNNARRIPVQYDASRPAHLHHAHKNNPSTPPPSLVQMSSVEEQSEPETSIYEPLSVPVRNNSDGSSPGQSSSNSSPPVSPPPLGNVDDLELYRDLFYRPRGMSVDNVTPPLNLRSPTRQLNIPWDVRSQSTNHTGLTNIVRQLSEELEETREARLSRSISFSSRSSLSILRQSAYGPGRSPLADSGLRFVFANIPETASVEAVSNVKPIGNEHENEDAQDAISAFYPSDQIPEDVETSSRASSPTHSAIEDDLDAYRLGHVESVSTPPAETGESRLSYMGQMSFAHGTGPEEEEDGDVLGTSPKFTRQTTAHNSLQPPSADPTRSSYLTNNSESSRMSGLSDFPTPPPQQLTPAHMSLLSSYFDETLTPSELAEVQAQGIHRRPGTRSRSGSVTATLATMRNTGQNTPADNQDSPHDQTSYFGNTKEIDDLIRLSPSTGR